MEKLQSEIKESLKDPLLKVSLEKHSESGDSPRSNDSKNNSFMSSFSSLKESQAKTGLSISMINKFKSLRKKNKISYEELDSLIMKKTEENKFREAQIKTLSENYSQFRQKRKYNDSVIDGVEREVLSADKTYKNYFKFKIQFLFDLLKNGKDVR